jgi:hypothetical protein
MSSSNSDSDHQVDYNLHGIVGVRLLNATPGDVHAVARQLGLSQTTLEHEPDIIIRFVERLPLCSPLRYLGIQDVGFTDDAFLVLRSKHKSHARVQIPMAQIGEQPCHIVSEQGVPAIPLLIPIVNLIALSKGVLPMHASAFRYRGQGVLTTGWSKGGKTELLLAFMANGAEYIGDEWVYISRDGSRINGIPEPIRVWDWHFYDQPQYWRRIGRKARMRLQLLKFMARSIEQVATNKLGSRIAPAKAMRRLLPLVKQQLHVDIPPQQLFHQELGPLSSTLDKILLVGNHESPEIAVGRVSPQEIAQRMVFSLQAERLDFISYYLKFRFAFPDARNQQIECAEERQRELLNQMLIGKEAYAVYHPYPFSIPSLFKAVSPFF